MKKTILSLFIVVLFSSLKAQDGGSSSSGGGLFIGTNIGYGIVTFKSLVKDETTFAGTTYNNLSYGIIAGYKINGLLSFQIEGNYANYGAHNFIPTYIYSPLSPLLTNFSSSSALASVDMDIYSVDIPFTIKFSFGKGDFSPYFYAGANYGVNVVGRSTFFHENTATDVVKIWKTYDDITPRIIKSELAPVGGCGLMFKMLKVSFFGDMRYKLGFKNLNNVENSLGFKNSALWVSAGLILKL